MQTNVTLTKGLLKEKLENIGFSNTYLNQPIGFSFRHSRQFFQEKREGGPQLDGHGVCMPTFPPELGAVERELLALLGGRGKVARCSMAVPPRLGNGRMSNVQQNGRQIMEVLSWFNPRDYIVATHFALRDMIFH